VSAVARAIAFLVGAALVLGTCLSAVKTFVVPRALPARITRTWLMFVRALFERVGHERRPFLARDRWLALMAPLGLITLPGIWVVLVDLGFTAMHWSVDHDSVRNAFLTSGSSLLTLGTLFHGAYPSAILTFVEAGLGLGLIALVISYLPSIYSAFSRRESLVAMLEVRAGVPPSPVELLVRYSRIGFLDKLAGELFPQWERWFAEVEESHTSLGALVFFRSPQPERSWVTAAGCVLDTAAVYLSTVDAQAPQAALCIRSGYLALGRIADVFGLPHPKDPAPTDPISISRREFDLMCVELQAAGVPLQSNRDAAWADFQGWRVNYDVTLVLLAKLVIAPPAKWSTDRPGARVRPTLRDPRRARRTLRS
jgi:hypothetical protein